MVHPMGTWGSGAPGGACHNIFRWRLHTALDTLRLLVDGSEMLHEAFLSEK
jgi:hypothetical protein